MITVNEIRQKFLEFFARRGHTKVMSSPIIPANDPTLLFTNAGMVQFKDVFLGTEKRAYVTACSAQKCIRAGGKHNDLENVGFTARHHTFFEMLGNFSFGSYFKREAIQLAWEFLTKELKLPAEKLWVTVYKDDKETANIWLNEIKVSDNRFSYCGEKDNFWSMGDTGPCGPCTEIFYDHGPDVTGGPPGTPDEEGDRYIEIWNLVFMQYNRDTKGNLSDLPKPSVDTGMGLERIAAVLQKVHSNYEIDTFAKIIDTAATIIGTKANTHASLKVIADHIRSTSMMICDGVLPSNEGRGYVLRRIIRRAIRHGAKLGNKDLFFHKLVKIFVETMPSSYPELLKRQKFIEETLLQEEQQFAKTINQGLGILEDAIINLKDKIIPGDIAFKLYDTYGFPIDLTNDVAREHGLTIDMQRFEQCMSEQKNKARAASQFKVNLTENDLPFTSKFIGYNTLNTQANILALYQENNAKDNLKEGEEGIIILDKTPFYAESGGQVGDIGVITSNFTSFSVKDTQKLGKAIAHIGIVTKGVFESKCKVTATVDAATRNSIIRNHSATHLMHAALRKVLGEHVQQKGSLVTSTRLRFDFAHLKKVTNEELIAIERMVNTEILKNTVTNISIMSKEDAIQKGAIAFFGDKYGETVRVLDFGDGYSVELCGGTHVKCTGDIGVFKIMSEAAVAAGVRRIEAITGEGVLQTLQQQTSSLKHMASALKTTPENVENKLLQLLHQVKLQEKTMQKLQQKFLQLEIGQLHEKAQIVKGVNVLAENLSVGDAKSLRTVLDTLKNKLENFVIALACVQDSRVHLVVAISKNLTENLHAGKLVSNLAQIVGGKGGGRPDIAQAGGVLPDKIPDALAKVNDWVIEQL